jgi:glycine/D-amino acid oxidase-like deaminating enzyme
MITNKKLSEEHARNNPPRNYDTIIIGGGQAGLVTGYYLQQQGHFCTASSGQIQGRDAEYIVKIITAQASAQRPTLDESMAFAA